ncbi:DUF6221 family protein [Streptomyces sp. NPDC005708]|uniref:DUF6221 family protein n=1 Tax=Streptomyces sp. NPDC005708 TaxID=3154564 RepID=UPI0034048BF0
MVIEWLRVQLDEDARIARAATEGPWSVNDESIIAADGTEVVAGDRSGGKASVFAATAMPKVRPLPAAASRRICTASVTPA